MNAALEVSAAGTANDVQAGIQQLFERGDYRRIAELAAARGSLDAFDPISLNRIARAFDGLGGTAEALKVIEHILARDPDNAMEHANLGVLCSRLGQPDRAVAAWDRVVALSPRDAAAWIKRAHALHQAGRRDASLVSADRALKIQPDDLEALNMRGMILDDLGRRDEARAEFEKALRIAPEYAEAITNIGILHGRSGEPRKALSWYEKSLEIKPDQLNTRYNRAVLLMLIGDWQRGFEQFESRWRLFPHEAGRLTRLAPRWDGKTDLSGKTVLLHHEQGFGDTIQFCRYAKWVESLGATVVVAAPAALVELLKSLSETIQVVTEGDKVPRHDFHCPMMSLPLAFDTTPDSVPFDQGYLRARPERILFWKERLGAAAMPRIGIAWAGRRYPPINHDRDMPLAALMPLLSLPAHFVCLHTELSDEERVLLGRFPHVSLEGLEVSDFADTASLMANLDLIITVDTAVAHLAGALGRPVWLMNRYATCWRWLLERADSPWYRTMRIYRQDTLGDWTSVTRRVEAQLADLLASHSVGLLGSTRAQSLQQALERALSLHRQANLPGAIRAYIDALSLDRECVHVHHYLGVALAQAGNHPLAAAHLKTALQKAPEDAQLLVHYGNVLQESARWPEARHCYERALVLAPKSAEVHYNLGVALMQSGELAEAQARFERAVHIEPNHAKALNNLGNLSLNQGDLARALLSYERVTGVASTWPDGWINRANTLRRLHRFEEALSCAKRASELDGANSGSQNAVGSTLLDMGRCDEAEPLLESAAARVPDYPEARWNLGLLRLAAGRWDEGWPLYESRWAVSSLSLKAPCSIPERLSEDDVRGESVLLHAEQGYGDTIQFCRYAMRLAEWGAQVTLRVPQSLVALLNQLPGTIKVVSQAERPTAAIECPLLSLPRLLGATVDNIPGAGGYLSVEKSRVLKWHQSIPEDGRLRVGIAWRGSSTHQNDARRSLPLALMQEVLTPDIQWVSLQRAPSAEDLPALDSAQVLRLGEECLDFADTAGLVANLDLVLSVDTSVAHVAGALCKSVWVLLPKVADWRWLQKRSDSPWYKSATLFRQTDEGDYGAVLRRVQSALRDRERVFRAHPINEGARRIVG